MYRPKIAEEQIKRLYQVKVKTGKPITKLVYEAINEFLDRIEIELKGGNNEKFN